MNITFRKISINDIDLIYSWLDKPHIIEFWDNTESHRQDIANFAEGRKSPSDYSGGRYVYWLGLYNGIPYCMLMIIQEFDIEDRPAIKEKYMSNTGNTYSIDFMIGNTDYLGKGYAAKTLVAFVTFIQTEYDISADTFFIDPDVTNPRAKHVYEKAGFQYVDDFIMGGDGCFSGRPSHFLVWRQESAKK